ncbi:GNAT family N-acetyltransferase [Paenisporosarcina indica]|uniref:GNAT family N-acetyltransferase n=1 Tax=Paenisporosarcina indica TaxID=650093 RepID=UPI00094FF4EB|nr:GNAT family N-acetyltransferase [Paenisporosarcina indica]
MNIQLREVSRNNWEEAMTIKGTPQQVTFAPPVAVSLAKVHIKPDGEDVTYIPFAIYSEEQMVGFIMHAYEEQTKDSYWINGFIIDEKYQGKGYGKAAFAEMVGWIQKRHPHCLEVRLTVAKENHRAKVLYERYGFVDTGVVYGNEEVYKFQIKR